MCVLAPNSPFFVCWEGGTLFAARPDVASVEGMEGTANCWIGFGSGYLGRWYVDRGRRKTTTAGNGGHLYTPWHMRDLGRSFRIGNRGIQAGEAEVGWVPQPRELAMGACGDWELSRFSGGQRRRPMSSPGSPFFFRSVPVSGVSNHNVMSSHREEGGPVSIM